jgi:hypothetical protein
MTRAQREQLEQAYTRAFYRAHGVNIKTRGLIAEIPATELIRETQRLLSLKK